MNRTFQEEIVGVWRTRDSLNYAYFDQVEGLTDGFWNVRTPFRRLFDQLDRRRLVEIACGRGRHTALTPPDYESFLAIDTSVDAIAECHARHGDLLRVRFVLSEDGCTIPAETGTQTAVFSYDAMVHFEPLTVNAYLAETARVLAPGGRGLFHHSNYDGNPTGKFTDAPHWRNYMNRDLFAHFCSRNGLRVLEQVELDWGQSEKLDALSLFEK